jgi:hypothetical protein
MTLIANVEAWNYKGFDCVVYGQGSDWTAETRDRTLTAESNDYRYSQLELERKIDEKLALYRLAGWCTPTPSTGSSA